VPWTNQNGGSGGQPKSPWGQPPSGGGMRPPDFETLLRKLWQDIRDRLPAGFNLGRRGFVVIAVAAAFLWLASGVYFVDTNEQGVVLRFGKFIKHTGKGPHYHLPWPIETAYTPNVTQANEIDIGYKPGNERNAENEDVSSEGYMLTGDENIVNMHFTVFWRIKDANAFLFNVDLPVGRPEETIKAVAESSMREAVGQDRMDLIMTSDRQAIQLKVKHLMQETLDSYNAGVEITDVKMQKAEPPSEVRDAYLDVQKALADQERKRSEAEAYQNSIIPQARGEAAHIVQNAQAYRQQVIAESTGEARRFTSIYQEYKKAPQVTRRRIYLESMTRVLAPMNKVIVDDSAKGVVPYFQLPQPPRPAAPQPAPRTPQGTVEQTTVSPADQGGNP
jgi:modulator of FtsH protease HflK